MTLDPTSIDVQKKSLASVDQAVKYVLTVEPSNKPGGVSEKFVREAYRLEALSSISAEVVVSQWAVETGAGTSPSWSTRLNPAGIGITDGGDKGYSWPTPEKAAQAQVVHLSGYVQGYNRNLRSYLDQDPRYLLVLETDFAQSVKTVADLTGKWATDPQYGDKIAWRLENLRNTPVGSGGGTTPPPVVVPANFTPIWEGTNNFHKRPLGTSMIEFLVHHVTDDMVFSNVKSWFQNPSSQASSTFVVDRDGSIHQFVSTLNSPWTNGDYEFGGVHVHRTDIPALNSAVNKCDTLGYNLNDFCVSIEYVGKPDVDFTEAQILSGINIGQYVIATYPKVSPHRFGQLRHADIDHRDRPYCPGPKFPLERIIKALGGDPTKLS